MILILNFDTFIFLSCHPLYKSITKYLGILQSFCRFRFSFYSLFRIFSLQVGNFSSHAPVFYRPARGKQPDREQDSTKDLRA